MILAASLLCVALLVVGTLYFLAVVRGILKGLIGELRSEREIVGLQKTIIGLTAEQIAIQRSMIDKRCQMVENGLTIMRLMVERQSDPKWMDKFNEGRDNAKNN